jgi:hypothetical protein
MLPTTQHQSKTLSSTQQLQMYMYTHTHTHASCMLCIYAAYDSTSEQDPFINTSTSNVYVYTHTHERIVYALYICCLRLNIRARLFHQYSNIIKMYMYHTHLERSGYMLPGTQNRTTFFQLHDGWESMRR